jgi:RNA polymerase sigma factor (TIGR02999 family)
MTEVSRILSAIQHGDPLAAEQLLPLVYDELRLLAAKKLAHEKAGQTLDATALVHEAYLRLVGGDASSHWDGCNHFFAAAAEAMRRILVDRTRQKAALKAGGNARRLDFDRLELAALEIAPDLLALDEALTELQKHDFQAAELVKLRFFIGLTHQQAAEALGIGRRAADRLWALARAWLYRQLTQD